MFSVSVTLSVEDVTLYTAEDTAAGVTGGPTGVVGGAVPVMFHVMAAAFAFPQTSTSEPASSVTDRGGGAPGNVSSGSAIESEGAACTGAGEAVALAYDMRIWPAAGVNTGSLSFNVTELVELSYSADSTVGGASSPVYDIALVMLAMLMRPDESTRPPDIIATWRGSGKEAKMSRWALGRDTANESLYCTYDSEPAGISSGMPRCILFSRSASMSSVSVTVSVPDVTLYTANDMVAGVTGGWIGGSDGGAVGGSVGSVGCGASRRTSTVRAASLEFPHTSVRPPAATVTECGRPAPVAFPRGTLNEAARASCAMEPGCADVILYSIVIASARMARTGSLRVTTSELVELSYAAVRISGGESSPR